MRVARGADRPAPVQAVRRAGVRPDASAATCGFARERALRPGSQGPFRSFGRGWSTAARGVREFSTAPGSVHAGHADQGGEGCSRSALRGPHRAGHRSRCARDSGARRPVAPREAGGAPGPAVSAVLVVGLLRGLQVLGAFGVMAGAWVPHGHEDSETLVASLHDRGHGLLADRADKRPLRTGLMLGFAHPLTIGSIAPEGDRGRVRVCVPPPRSACRTACRWG